MIVSQGFVRNSFKELSDSLGIRRHIVAAAVTRFCYPSPSIFPLPFPRSIFFFRASEDEIRYIRSGGRSACFISIEINSGRREKRQAKRWRKTIWRYSINAIHETSRPNVNPPRPVPCPRFNKRRKPKIPLARINRIYNGNRADLTLIQRVYFKR